jgi:hypothetical protein
MDTITTVKLRYRLQLRLDSYPTGWGEFEPLMYGTASRSFQIELIFAFAPATTWDDCTIETIIHSSNSIPLMKPHLLVPFFTHPNRAIPRQLIISSPLHASPIYPMTPTRHEKTLLNLPIPFPTIPQILHKLKLKRSQLADQSNTLRWTSVILYGKKNLRYVQSNHFRSWTGSICTVSSIHHLLRGLRLLIMVEIDYLRQNFVQKWHRTAVSNEDDNEDNRWIL